MPKIAHISDTHINRLKYHKEYKEVFDDIYETLIDEKVDLIVHTGDIFHSKLEMTPECTKVAYDFLTELANIAMESGGYNQRMYETMAHMLIELRLMNILLQEGLNIHRDDLQSMRDELTNNLSLDAIKEI